MKKNNITKEKAKDMITNPSYKKKLSSEQLRFFQTVAHDTNPYKEGEKISNGWLDKYNDHIPSAQGGDTIRSKSLGELEANVNAFGIHLPYFVSKNFPELRDRIPDPSLVGLDDLSDALRHAGAASDFAGEKWYNKLPLPARILIPNLAGLAHELDPRVGQNLPTQTASDLYNNFMGSLVGAMIKNDSIRGRMIGEMAKKNILSDLSHPSSVLGKFNKKLTNDNNYQKGGAAHKAQKEKLVSNKDFETPPEGYMYPKEWHNWWLNDRTNTVETLAKEAGIPSEGIIDKAKNKINTLPEYKSKSSSPKAYYVREGKLGNREINSSAAYLGYDPLIPLTVGIHEPTHGISNVLPEELEEGNIANIVSNAIRQNDPKLKEFFKDKDYYYRSPWEVKARLNEFRYLYGLDPKRNYTVDDIKNIIANPPNKEFIEHTRKVRKGGADDLLDMFTPEEILELHNKTVMNKGNANFLPKAQNGGYIPKYQPGGILKYQEGGVIKDNNGYWNPDNWGKPVEIASNNITMRGVRQPLLGISNTGDVQYMSPGNDYKFKGSRVTEIPMFQGGGNMKKFQTGGEEELPSIYDRNHGDILQWWNNEFLKNEEFKSGILPTRYNLDKLNLPKKPALDFSKTGLPKDWRVLNALYNQSMNTAYLNGYPPKVSDEILNIAKLEQKEGLGKIMLDRAIFAGGDTKFQSKQYSPAFKYNEFGDIGYIKEGDPLTSRDIMNSNNLYYGNVDNTPFLYRYESYPLFFKKNYYDKNTGEPVFYGNDIPIVNEKLEWQGYKDAEYSIPRMYGYDPFNMSEENWNNLIKDVKTSIDKGGTSISGLVGRKNPWFGKQITMNKEQDPNFKLLNVSPEITEYNKKIVEKMKGIPSTFKHSQTSLQELIEEAPSLFSGQYKDKRLPFEGSVEKLKELAEKEKLSEQDIEYINTEMLRATALKESLAVRKNILARIENPSFVKALLNRNIKDEDKKELNWKEDNKEYNQQLHQFADMVPLIKSDLRNTGFTVQSDFRGDEFGNMAMRVPFTAGDNDLMQELRSEHKDMSDIALGFSPHYAGAHEYWHNIQRGGIPYKGGYRKMSNPEIVNPKLESFLKTYDPKVLDKYWESTDEFDADNFQLLYNIAYDPINRQKSVNKPLGTDINVKDIDSYFYDLDTSVKSNKMIKYDPAAERVGRMWSSSTPKQKLEYIKLLNNYYANGGQIKKQQGGQIKSNVQMKNQEHNLKELLNFGNYNKKMKSGGWLDKFND